MSPTPKTPTLYEELQSKGYNPVLGLGGGVAVRIDATHMMEGLDEICARHNLVRLATNTEGVVFVKPKRGDK